MSAHGSYDTTGGRPALVFERRLVHPVDRVWRAVSDPEQLPRWFPTVVASDTGAMEVGAVVTHTFPGDDAPSDTGKVVDAHAPELLAFTWFGDVLTFELEPLDGGDGTRLHFAHLLLTGPGAAARTLAGWHVCLDVLDRFLGGEATHGPGTAATGDWQRHYDHYVAGGAPHGAPVPRTGA